MSDPIINTKITADTAQAEQAIRTVKRSVQDLSESTQSATSLMGTSWTQMATAFGAGSIVAKAIEGVISLISQIPSAIISAVKSIDSLKISTIQIAAAITNMQGPKDAAEHYAKASKYAETLAVKLQDVDAKSFANYQTLLAMTNTMTLQGVVLDVNNKKQVDSFTALSNAVAMYTAGQNQSVQAHQEIRALMSGETTQGSILAKQIDDQAKSQGLYKGGLKEIVAEGKKHGDLLERLTPFLVGINAASGDIAKTWEAVTSSAETSGNMIQRIGFAGLYESAVAFGSQAVTWLKAQAEVIGGGIARAWLSVKGIMETISLLFNSQDGSLRMITAAIKTVLGLVNEILYGWAFLLSTVLPTVAEKFNAIVNIMSAVVHMGYAFGAAMIDSIVAVAKAFASFGMGMTKALTGDFAGMKQEFSKIFGADFKTLMADNVLVMKGTVIAMKEEWGKLKDTSTFNNRFDAFIGKEKATEAAEVPIIPPGKPAPEKAIDHSSEINTVISDYNRLQQETIKTDQSITELSRTLGVLEFQNKKSADSFIATYNSSAQARAEFDKQGITLAKINALYVELKNNATIKSDNKDYWDGVNARWREGKHEIDQVEQAIKRVFALGKNGEESPLYAFADDVHKATMAFTQAGDAFGVTAEAYVSAIEGAVSKLTGVTLKGLNSQNTDLAASQVGVDMSTGQVTDPYAQQQAMMEARYQKEFDLIDERTNKLKAAMKAEADSLVPNLTIYEALQKQMLASSKNRVLKEKQQTIDQGEIDEKSFKSRLSMTSQYTSMAGELFSALASTQDQSSRKGFETAKMFNIAAAIMSTAAGIMAQFAAPDGALPSAWARAALVGVTGAIQIAKIASTSFGSGGGVAGAPSGSFGGAGGSSSTGTGLSNLPQQVSSIQDSRTNESIDRLVESTDNSATVIGKLSKSIDALSALFESGGAGYSLANNAPNKYQQTQESEASLIQGLFGYKSGGFTPMDAMRNISTAVFGGGWKTTGAGLSLGVDSGQVAAQDYTTSGKDGGWFKSDKSSTSYSANSEASDYMNSLIAPFVSDITNMARTLGTTFNPENYTVAATQIATAGRTTEDIGKDVEAWMLTVLQGMSLQVAGLDQAAGDYDDVYATLKLLNDALVSTNDAFALVGITTLQGSIENAKWAVSLQALMGGAEEFTTKMDDYFTAMYTDSEQAAMKSVEATKKVNDTFAELGYSVPSTNAVFNQLRNGLDVTTTSGAQLFAALTEIAPAFAEMTKQADALLTSTQDLTVRLLNASGQSGLGGIYELRIKQEKELAEAVGDKTLLIQVQTLEMADAMKTAANTIADATQKIIDTAKTALTDSLTLIQNILNTKKTLLTGPAAMLSPEAAYRQAKEQFNNSDATNVSANVTAFVEASKNFAPSKEAYQSDYQAALAKLDQFSGTTGDLSNVEQQLALLSKIAKAVGDDDGALVSKLSTTWNALQIVTKDATGPLAVEYNKLTQLISGIDPNTGTMYVLTDTAAVAVNTAILAMQAATGKTITDTSIIKSINDTISSIQGSMKQNITDITAKTAIDTAISAIQGAMAGTVTNTTAQTAITNAVAAVNTSMAANITNTTAGTAITNALTTVQGAMAGTIDTATATSTITAAYGIVSTELGSGMKPVGETLSTVMDSFVTKLGLWVKAMSDAVTEAGANSTNLANQTAAIDTFTKASTAYQTTAATLLNQYKTGTISTSGYTTQNDTAYAPVAAAYTAATNLGVTSLPAPSETGITTADTDARMKIKAGPISAAVGVGIVTPGQPPTYNAQWDIGSIMADGSIQGQRDGVIDWSDYWSWKLISQDTQLYSQFGVPAYATGGDHLGGFRIVGEYGPELEATGASRIFNADQTRNIFANGQADNRDMVEAIARLEKRVEELLAEQHAANVAIAKNTGDTSRKLNRWDGEGMPPVREAA